MASYGRIWTKNQGEYGCLMATNSRQSKGIAISIRVTIAPALLYFCRFVCLCVFFCLCAFVLFCFVLFCFVLFCFYLFITDSRQLLSMESRGPLIVDAR